MYISTSDSVHTRFMLTRPTIAELAVRQDCSAHLPPAWWSQRHFWMAGMFPLPGDAAYYYAFVDGIETVRSAVAFPRHDVPGDGALYTQYRFDCIRARNFDINVPVLWHVDPDGKHANLDPNLVAHRAAEQNAVIRDGNHCMIYATVPNAARTSLQRMRLANWYLLIVVNGPPTNDGLLGAELFDDVPLDVTDQFFGDDPRGVSIVQIADIPKGVRRRLLEVISFNHIPDIVLPPAADGPVTMPRRDGH